MTDKKQAFAELATFRRFADVCPVAIDPVSIEKTDPPEPDIVCRFAETGEEVAFELVEIIDQDWARLTSDQFREAAALRAAYESASGGLRFALDNQLPNALVHVAFLPGLASQERKGAVPLILHELSSLPADQTGIWRPGAGTSLATTVRSITISRGEFHGPQFDVEAVSSIGDPTVERIRSKWQKSYATSRPIELLAFYELQPLIPGEIWKSRLDSFVRMAWSSGPIRRVWLFDVGSKSIPYRADRPIGVGSAA